MSDVLVQYLREARATEAGLTQTLQVHIAATPPGDHRARLELHLNQTRAHEQMLAARLGEMDEGQDPLRQALTLVSAPVGYGLGVARGATRAMLSVVGWPLTLLRGPEPSAADRVLRNVRAESASEALEVATYTAIERLAEAEGDEETARLAAEIRAEEEEMLAYLREAVVELSDRLGGKRPQARKATGHRPQATEHGALSTEHGAPSTEDGAPSTEHSARASNGAPGPATRDLRPATPAEPAEPAHVSEEPELVAEFGPADDAGAEVEVAEPWEGYDRMRAAEISQRLADSSDELVAVVSLYETAGKRRQSILRIAERRLRVG
jgi:ferritin-like metal-binding protein YciE